MKLSFLFWVTISFVTVGAAVLFLQPLIDFH